jgi:hypothetical protein
MRSRATSFEISLKDDLQKKIIIPSCLLTFSFNAAFRRILPQQSHRNLPQQRKILGRIFVMNRRSILTKANIQRPVEFVFNLPMTPNFVFNNLS